MPKSAIKSKKFKNIALTKSKMNDIIYTVKGGEMMDDIKEAIQLIALIIGSVVAILTGIEKVLSILIKIKQLNRK
nr:MAG TPA: hypothetical protein [Caudoviricetes sp.]